MNLYRTAAGHLQPYVRSEKHQQRELIDLTDHSPAAYARQVGLRAGDLAELLHPTKERDPDRRFEAWRDECLARAQADRDDAYMERLERLDRAAMKAHLERINARSNPEVLQYSRIWMGVHGPEGAAPPYACVVGERFDGVWGRQERRPLVLLDECKSLEEHQYPDLVDFFAGLVALKDLYRPEQEHVDFRIYYIPPRRGAEGLKLDPFWDRLYRLPGLVYYDEDRQPHEHRARYPLFKSTFCRAGVQAAPFEADPDRLRYKMESLFAHDQLIVRPHCTIYDSAEYPTPELTVAMVALALEAFPWIEELRDTQDDGSGYGTREEREAAERALSAEQRRQRRRRDTMLESAGAGRRRKDKAPRPSSRSIARKGAAHRRRGA